MKKRSYIATMAVLSILFLIGRFYIKGNGYIEVVSTVLAIIAAVAFWVEFKSNERINEAQLIMELNDQFVTNPQFSHVEWELEKYYDAYKIAETEGENTEIILFGINLEIINEERQNVVNYLVHLEGIAALINEGVLRLNVISDLMAYRYFIAVNNPIIQRYELLPYKEYYKGIFNIYKKWEMEIGKENVPMERNGLSQVRTDRLHR